MESPVIVTLNSASLITSRDTTMFLLGGLQLKFVAVPIVEPFGLYTAVEIYDAP